MLCCNFWKAFKEINFFMQLEKLKNSEHTTYFECAKYIHYGARDTTRTFFAHLKMYKMHLKLAIQTKPRQWLCSDVLIAQFRVETLKFI